MHCKAIFFSGHAIRRMFQRNITQLSVIENIRQGKIITHYPDDSPHPSYLLLGLIENKPLHIVLAKNPVDKTCIVITAYTPDPNLWHENFTKKVTP